MAYSDPEKQREYQREWQRMKRAGNNGKVELTNRYLNPEDIKTAKGLRDLLADTMSDVQAAEVDVLTKARCIGYLVSIALKTVETADLESRLQDLEGILKLREVKR